ncbi:hypothetical protein D918_02052 [Trichuris suis]|nr:hypothetical protein D918_02052 [Trichuris suis]
MVNVRKNFMEACSKNKPPSRTSISIVLADAQVEVYLTSEGAKLL